MLVFKLTLIVVRPLYLNPPMYLTTMETQERTTTHIFVAVVWGQGAEGQVQCYQFPVYLTFDPVKVKVNATNFRST